MSHQERDTSEAEMAKPGLAQLVVQHGQESQLAWVDLFARDGPKMDFT
jgi:hypothetical protein